jgi:hypothetical protein
MMTILIIICGSHAKIHLQGVPAASKEQELDLDRSTTKSLCQVVSSSLEPRTHMGLKSSAPCFVELMIWE